MWWFNAAPQVYYNACTRGRGDDVHVRRTSVGAKKKKKKEYNERARRDRFSLVCVLRARACRFRTGDGRPPAVNLRGRVYTFFFFCPLYRWGRSCGLVEGEHNMFYSLAAAAATAAG